MNILITGAASRLSRELAHGLGRTHSIRLTDRTEVSTMHRFVRADLGHDAPTNNLVRGVDAIIHSGLAETSANVSDQLDAAMRGTYNLLWAAWQEGIQRVVYLSSLGVMNKYSEELAVTERWKPTPSTDPNILSHHLGEFVCREFARERKLSVICLRLGDIVWDETSSSTRSALFPDDLLQAVEQSLTVEVVPGWTSEPNPWNIFHIQSSVGGQRFLTNTAREVLGFSPAIRG